MILESSMALVDLSDTEVDTISWTSSRKTQVLHMEDRKWSKRLVGVKL